MRLNKKESNLWPFMLLLFFTFMGFSDLYIIVTMLYTFLGLLLFHQATFKTPFWKHGRFQYKGLKTPWDLQLQEIKHKVKIWEMKSQLLVRKKSKC